MERKRSLHNLWLSFPLQKKVRVMVLPAAAALAAAVALIALAVAGAVQCPYCIDSYTQSCLEKGVTEEQMTEAFHVANAIRGGAALVHGVQMKNVVKQLEM